MKRFFISDLHFQDERLNLYARDLMFKNSKDVDDYIIKIWNEKITNEDLVIVVGDVSMTKDGLNNLKKLLLAIKLLYCSFKFSSCINLFKKLKSMHLV